MTVVGESPAGRGGGCFRGCPAGQTGLEVER